MKNEELVLNLIKEDKTLEEIINVSGLSIKDVYRILNNIKKMGYCLSKKYYYDGETEYKLMNNIGREEENILITSPKDNELEFMVISDLHFGSLYETPKLLNMIYDYCTKKNIHIILNCGDFIEGDINSLNIAIPPFKQINHALKIHPLSKDILNYLLLGNHDYSLLTNYGINIMETIKMRREDIIPIGFKEGIIKIKNDQIILQHPILHLKSSGINYAKALIIRGHGHATKVTIDTSNIIIYAPSLSKLNFNKCDFPGAIDLRIKMRKGIIEYVYIEELAIISNKIHTTNELNLYFGNNKSFKDRNCILNEEEYPKVLRKEK